jgi:hypothetical protein
MIRKTPIKELIRDGYITEEEWNLIRADWPERTQEEWKAWDTYEYTSIEDLARAISDTLDFSSTAFDNGNSSLGQAYLRLVYGTVTRIGFTGPGYE